MANSKNYSVLNGKLNITGNKILQFRQKQNYQGKLFLIN